MRGGSQTTNSANGLSFVFGGPIRTPSLERWPLGPVGPALESLRISCQLGPLAPGAMAPLARFSRPRSPGPTRGLFLNRKPCALIVEICIRLCLFGVRLVESQRFARDADRAHTLSIPAHAFCFATGIFVEPSLIAPRCDYFGR